MKKRNNNNSQQSQNDTSRYRLARFIHSAGEAMTGYPSALTLYERCRTIPRNTQHMPEWERLTDEQKSQWALIAKSLYMASRPHRCSGSVSKQ